MLPSFLFSSITIDNTSLEFKCIQKILQIELYSKTPPLYDAIDVYIILQIGKIKGTMMICYNVIANVCKKLNIDYLLDKILYLYSLKIYENYHHKYTDMMGECNKCFNYIYVDDLATKYILQICNECKGKKIIPLANNKALIDRDYIEECNCVTFSVNRIYHNQNTNIIVAPDNHKIYYSRSQDIFSFKPYDNLINELDPRIKLLTRGVRLGDNGNSFECNQCYYNLKEPNRIIIEYSKELDEDGNIIYIPDINYLNIAFNIYKDYQRTI